MEIYKILTSAGIVALLSLLVTLFPLGAGAAYLIRPTEDRLALMRPVSLAGIFAALSGTMAGFINVLRSVWVNDPPPTTQVLAVGTAESLVPLFVGFGCLTVAWLCIAVGLRRRPS
jgi:hypothetical protein